MSEPEATDSGDVPLEFIRRMTRVFTLKKLFASTKDGAQPLDKGNDFVRSESHRTFANTQIVDANMTFITARVFRRILLPSAVHHDNVALRVNHADLGCQRIDNGNGKTVIKYTVFHRL